LCQWDDERVVGGMKPIRRVASISGGKDSTATMLIMMDRHPADEWKFVMADTGNEHPLTLEYATDYLPRKLGVTVDVVKADFSAEIARRRVYVETMWPSKGVPDADIQRVLKHLHPSGNAFLDLCLWKGRFPSRTRQFCTQYLKRIPLDAYLLDLMAEGYEVESWRGIRRDESQNRKDAIEFEVTAEGYKIVHPVVAWTAQQVVDFVTSRGVLLNPLYLRGMKRVGCMPCINCGKDEIAEIFNRAPEHIDKIREWEETVSYCAKRGWTTFFADKAMTSPTPISGWTRTLITDEAGAQVEQWVESDGDIFERLRIDKRVEWAKTARGGKQLDLLKFNPHPDACSSLYGLCE